MIFMLIFICFILIMICECFQHHQLSIIHDYVAYGGELQQAEMYFNITSFPAAEKQLYEKLYYCFNVHQVQSCINTATDQFGVIKNPEHPEFASYVNTSDHDCSFSIDLTSIIMKDNNIMHYNIDIKQHSCQSNYSFPGGMSFDIFGRTNESLTTCKYHDNFDNSYKVICSVFMKSESLPIQNDTCIHLIVNYYFEHFGVYSEVVKSSFISGRNNNFTAILCGNIQSSQSNKPLIFGKQELLSLNTEYITGIWLDKDLSNYWNQSTYRYDNSAYHQPSYLAYNQSLPFIQIGNKYKFQPVVITDNQIRMPLGMINNTNIIENLKNKSNHIFTFIGASHMRYNFDAIMNQIYGDTVLNNVYGGHDYLDIHQFHAHISTASFETVYADDQTGKLWGLCNSFKSISGKNHTIIFQTGAWDLGRMK